MVYVDAGAKKIGMHDIVKLELYRIPIISVNT